MPVSTKSGFAVHNVASEWLAGRTHNQNGLTWDSDTVYSYALLLAFKDTDGTIWMLDPKQKFSVTTSKHQSGLHGGLAKLGYEIDHETFQTRPYRGVERAYYRMIRSNYRIKSTQ